MKKRNLIIDGDHLLYNVVPMGNALGGEDIGSGPSFKKLKRAFKDEVQRAIDDAAVEAMGEFKIGKTKVVISDMINFRYNLFPEYKANRKQLKKPPIFYELQDWARQKYLTVPNCEADDVCGYYVSKKNWVGLTTDKDLIFGVGGLWFDAYPSRREWREQSDYEAHRFVLMQTLAGDLGDGIPGLPRVGLKTAEKLLNESPYGWTWESVVNLYLEHGFDENRAILMRRLVDMTQLHKVKGEWIIRLFSPA